MASYKTIEIYAGPGACEIAIQHTTYTLRKLIHPQYTIQTTILEKIRGTSWGKNTALFIMPGGVDFPYHQYLKGDGNKKLKDYVQQGGSYLGFCAGAYYASEQISFSQGTYQEVMGARELAFFQGTAEGPILKPWNAQSNSGADIALLQWTGPHSPFAMGQNFVTYYNGGCHFVQAEVTPNVTVLAHYLSTTPSKAAIIEITQGKGHVILSGVHCEFAPALFNQHDPYLLPLQETFIAQDQKRLHLMAHLLERLGIELIS
jgi:glutamine amidotransferase-like uncharacterized protein